MAIWGGSLEKPLTAFLQVPREVRLSWAKQRTSQEESLRDIFEVEAIGPLVILATWPGLLQGCLWLHFIDNVASQAALIKGSSSVTSTTLSLAKPGI